MGQTLTNGIYLPDEGEVRCYEGLASNWTTLDAVIGGYRAHVANENIHITSAERNKWDNGVSQAYVLRYANTSLTALGTVAFSALDNTDNLKTGDKVLDSEGKLFALTAVDTANSTATLSALLIDLADDSNVMHLAGAESIAGQKTFSDNTFFTANVYHKYTSYESGNIPANNLVSNVYLADKNNVYVGYLRNVIYTSGRTSTEIRAKNTIKNGVLDPTGDDISSNLNVEVQPNGAKTIYWDGLIRNDVTPFTTGNNFLGTSANKWKALNGLNPGTLSMPNLSAAVDISGYITAGVSHNEYTPTVDGWISVTIKKTDTTGALALFIYQGDICNSYFGNTSLPNESEFSGMASIPVKAGAVVNIDLKGSNTYVYSAKFYPCQGNV